jgi:hypothetical protein
LVVILGSVLALEVSVELAGLVSEAVLSFESLLVNNFLKLEAIVKPVLDTFNL